MINVQRNFTNGTTIDRHIKLHFETRLLWHSIKAIIGKTTGTVASTLYLSLSEEKPLHVNSSLNEIIGEKLANLHVWIRSLVPWPPDRSAPTCLHVTFLSKAQQLKTNNKAVLSRHWLDYAHSVCIAILSIKTKHIKLSFWISLKFFPVNQFSKKKKNNFLSTKPRLFLRK